MRMPAKRQIVLRESAMNTSDNGVAGQAAFRRLILMTRFLFSVRQPLR